MISVYFFYTIPIAFFMPATKEIINNFMMFSIKYENSGQAGACPLFE